MFYGIGTGVGSSDSVTVRAANALQKLDILYVPLSRKEGTYSVAHKIVSKYLTPHTEIKERHFPMNYDTEELKCAWNSIAAEIEADAAVKEVGFVTIGDPMVYSTYIYLLRILKDKIKTETIPGITSFQDIAANNNFPLVEGDDPLIILPATKNKEELSRYLREENSIVLMKVYKNYNEIISLIEENQLADCAIAVSNSSKTDERIFYDVREMKQEDVSYFTTILINKRWKKQ